MHDSFTIREESLNKCINSTKMTQIEHEQWDIETKTLIPVNYLINWTQGVVSSIDKKISLFILSFSKVRKCWNSKLISISRDFCSLEKLFCTWCMMFQICRSILTIKTQCTGFRSYPIILFGSLRWKNCYQSVISYKVFYKDPGIYCVNIIEQVLVVSSTLR